MLIIMSGMVIAFIAAVMLLPSGVGMNEALHIAGSMNKLNLIDFSFDLENRYNFWSGIIGGMFVALAYLVQTSRRCSATSQASRTTEQTWLLFNGMAKIPMQFFILLLGVMVFVVFQFERPPLFFNRLKNSRSSRGIMP